MEHFEIAPEGLRAKADELNAEAQVLRQKAESCEIKARYLWQQASKKEQERNEDQPE